MKTLKLIMVSIAILLCSVHFLKAQVVVAENFEGESCGSGFWSTAFFDGCVDNWISVSGSANLFPVMSLSPYEGDNYATMHSPYNDFNGATPLETIALEYNFQAGIEYTISFAIAWRLGEVTNCNPLTIQWILTNDKVNSMGYDQTPISPTDEIIQEFVPGASSGGWIYETITFTPSSNYNQLWLRTYPNIDVPCIQNGSFSNAVYLDAFSLVECDLDPSFSYTVKCNEKGEAIITLMADNLSENSQYNLYSPSTPSTSDPLGPELDSKSGNNVSFSVPYEPGSFYVVKHGNWTEDCNWTEKRKLITIPDFSSNLVVKPIDDTYCGTPSVWDPVIIDASQSEDYTGYVYVVKEVDGDGSTTLVDDNINTVFGDVLEPVYLEDLIKTECDKWYLITIVLKNKCGIYENEAQFNHWVYIDCPEEAAYTYTVDGVLCNGNNGTVEICFDGPTL